MRVTFDGGEYDKHAHRRVLWRVLPSKAFGGGGQKEKVGNAMMWAAEDGTLSAESDELGMKIVITAPDKDSRFEFSEPVKRLDLAEFHCAKLKHGSTWSRDFRSWDFFLIIENCECILISTVKDGKKQNAVRSSRIVGFSQDKATGGYKILVFKGDGKLSPIFEFSLTSNQFLVAKGPMAAALPKVAKKIARLKPVDKMNWVAPHMRSNSTSQEVNLLDLPEEYL